MFNRKNYKPMKKPLIFMSLIFLCSCGDVFESDISGSRIDMIAPADGAEVEEGTVAFLWNTLNGSERYRITIVSPSFEDALRAIADTIIYPDTLALGAALRVKLTPASYQWSIQAFNSAYSSVRSEYDLTVTGKEEEEPAEPDEEADI